MIRKRFARSMTYERLNNFIQHFVTVVARCWIWWYKLTLEIWSPHYIIYALEFSGLPLRINDFCKGRTMSFYYLFANLLTILLVYKTTFPINAFLFFIIVFSRGFVFCVTRCFHQVLLAARIIVFVWRHIYTSIKTISLCETILLYKVML